MLQQVTEQAGRQAYVHKAAAWPDTLCCAPWHITIKLSAGLGSAWSHPHAQAYGVDPTHAYMRSPLINGCQPHSDSAGLGRVVVGHKLALLLGRAQVNTGLEDAHALRDGHSLIT